MDMHDIDDTIGSDLTERQRDLMAVIERYVATNGYAPSVRELGELIGLKSPSSVKHQIGVLTKKGYIARVQGRPRAIDILKPLTASTPYTTTDSADEAHSENSPSHPRSENSVTPVVIPVSDFNDGDLVEAPLVGTIAAGTPITAEQHVDDIFRLPQRFTGNGQLFALEVRGDSMVDAAICDGDVVIIRQQPTAIDGEIVAAMIDGEATVKVLSHSEGHVWLLPRNENYAPIPGDEATILGKVVTVIRAV